MLHFAHELTSRLGGAVKDMVPPEAQWHLLNAQRELMTALFLIYEHQAAVRRGQNGSARGRDGEVDPESRRRRRSAAATGAAGVNGTGPTGGRPAARTKRPATAGTAPPRLSKIDIE